MNNYQMQYLYALDKKYQDNLKKGKIETKNYLLNPFSGRLVDKNGKIGKSLNMMGGGCNDQSEVALSMLASEYGLGAPVMKWEPNDDFVSGYLTLHKLQPQEGWKTIEEYGSNLPLSQYRLAVKNYVEKLFRSPLRAANAYEWHGGNVFYNEITNEILRIDWDPDEGDCYIVGCSEPEYGIKDKQGYIDVLTKLGINIQSQPPVQSSSTSSDKLQILEDRVIKKITKLRTTSALALSAEKPTKKPRRASYSPRGPPMGKLFF